MIGLILIFPAPFLMAMLLETIVPLVLDLVFFVVEVGRIGIQFETDVVALIEHHLGGERRGHLPGASI